MSKDPEAMSASWLKKLLETMNEGVWVGDAHEKTVYANKKLLDMIGFNMGELHGKESYIFWDKESADRVRYVNEHERKKGISSQYEGNLQSKSGKKIPVLASGAPLDGGGTIALLSNLSELKKRESLYKKLVEHMNEGVWVSDEDHQTIYVNPKCCEMMEYSAQELKGKSTTDFMTPESAMKMKTIHKTHRLKGMSSSYEIQLITKSGTILPVLVNGTPLPNGGTMGILTDLREMKEREKEEKILNTAIKFSTDAIIVFNQHGKIQSWNKGAKIIFGYKEREMIGASLEKMLSKADLKHLLELSEIRYNFELKAKHRNKTQIKISATITPITSEEKHEEVFYLLIARDITNQSKYEEEIALKYQKIKEAYNQFGVIRRQMDYVFELINMVSEHSDPKTIADFIVSSIIMLTRVDACILRTYNEKKGTLDLLSAFGVAEEWRGKTNIKFEKSLAEKAFDQKTILRIIDVTKEPKYQSRFLAKKQNLCSLELIPLIYRGKMVGSLSLYSSPHKKLEIFENEFIERYAKLIELVIGAEICCEGK